jgi:DNA-binding NarL/FixJ family response regulator
MIGTYVRRPSDRELRFPALHTARTSATITRTVPTSVLIVDDHPSFRASARAMLESEGYSVVGEAESGEAALAAIDALEPDVVLLDVQLPDMSGFDVCQKVDRMHRAGRPAIVLVSSRDLDDYGDLVDTSCARGFVPKAELSGRAVAALLR